MIDQRGGGGGVCVLGRGGGEEGRRGGGEREEGGAHLSHNGPTSNRWRSVLATAHPGMVPRWGLLLACIEMSGTRCNRISSRSCHIRKCTRSTAFSKSHRMVYTACPAAGTSPRRLFPIAALKAMPCRLPDEPTVCRFPRGKPQIAKVERCR